ncbi:hypothetical protein A0H76_487 [Hepatospora eriocheir]|uniref:Uncharacterized protein n=1 Tax=Hepatospora eriocheir TaxID=1081669 RepID=A0A1X0Q8Z4_9MICR|nr:hypothetical protein A0H76_487 [Hepatospora eriocheir]
MRNRRGTTLQLLQSHISFFCFCYRYNEANLFIIFMKLLTKFKESIVKQYKKEDSDIEITK